MGLLDSVLGGGFGARGGGGMSPLTMGLVGLLAYRTFQGKGRLADLLGRSAPNGGIAIPGQEAAATPGTGLGGLLGGGAAGGILSSGLQDLLGQFHKLGQGDTAQSWVSTGANKEITPTALETVLGPEKITWLMNETGLSRDELLSGLSRELPQAVDKLTPDGRIPTGEEAARII
jgi:uncharacterized protein YidB (DUF937 family)